MHKTEPEQTLHGPQINYFILPGGTISHSCPFVRGVNIYTQPRGHGYTHQKLVSGKTEKKAEKGGFSFPFELHVALHHCTNQAVLESFKAPHSPMLMKPTPPAATRRPQPLRHSSLHLWEMKGPETATRCFTNC